MGEAAGSARDFKLISKISEIFPDACPNYIAQKCSGLVFSNDAVSQLVDTIILVANYPKRPPRSQSPKREMNPEEQTEWVKSVLPDLDPEYTTKLILSYANKTQELGIHITELLNSGNYPRSKNDARMTMKRSDRQRKLNQQLQYTDKFNLDNFMKLFPDPEAHFNDPLRKPIEIDIGQDSSSYNYAVQFLKNFYNCLPQRTINDEFRNNKYNVLKTAKALDYITKHSKGNIKGALRRKVIYFKTIENIPLLQEIAYIQHRAEIISFLKKKNRIVRQRREQVRRCGLFKTCQCCYDEELLPEDIVICENNCIFCKDCINRSVEISFSEGKTDFDCLQNCGAYFNIKTLQDTVPAKLMSKILQKKQHEEVQASGIEGLATCPFCNFAIIMDASDKILQCLNTQCMKETCRLCKEPSHIPLRCDEVEIDDTQARTYLENKMSEALLRKCYKCNLKFIKSDGCNKITCSCGAKMCYVCNEPVQDYSHFNGSGGGDLERCPLFSDTHELHLQGVLREAKRIKLEISEKGKGAKLKHDPSVDIEEYYQRAREQHPELLPAGVVP